MGWRNGRNRDPGGWIRRAAGCQGPGIPARVTLTAGGVTQMLDVRGGEGHYNPQRPLVLHFGLGKAAAVTSVKVKWVGGATEIITGVKPRGTFLVVEGSGKAVSSAK